MRTLCTILCLLLCQISQGQKIFSFDTSSDWTKLREAPQSVVILQNRDDFLPVQQLALWRIASLSIGTSTENSFQQTLSLYTQIPHFQLSTKSNTATIDSVSEILTQFDWVILSLHKEITQNEALQVLVASIMSNSRNIVCSFIPIEEFAQLDWIDKPRSLIISEDNSPEAQSYVAQTLFGGAESTGKLSQAIGNIYPADFGLALPNRKRLGYTLPEAVGINSVTLQVKIDSIAHFAIREGATPGMQVLVAKDGNVFFHKSYGYHTYDSLRPTLLTDVYDLASITKIAAPLPALMRLHDERKIKLNLPLSTYWAGWQNGNKKKLPLKKILAHQARLRDWIPYWKKTVKRNGEFMENTFLKDSTSIYSVRVTDSLWLHKDYQTEIFKAIRKSKLNRKKGYIYSGLSFYIYPQVIETLTGDTYTQYLDNTFYKPLGANYLCFTPKFYFPLTQIIPTEIDTFFRKTLLHGYVDDEGAAMMGGISGNAGLFGNANDLAKLMQLYLQEGTYGGEFFFSKQTFNTFNTRYYSHLGNRRALGFDKPLLQNPENGTPSPLASSSSFGHTGYTGTFAWADPETGLLFVFLCNRLHPSRYNRKLYQLNIRTAMHQVCYELSQIKNP